MVLTLIALVLCILFLILGGFHFYWLLGGTWGLTKVIPTKDTQSDSLAIPKFATLIVALVLTAFGGLYFLKTGWVQMSLPEWVTAYGYWFIPTIFLLRAIGDFKYVGVFKSIKNTEFAKVDARVFIPLCLVVGVMGMLVQFI